MDNCCGCSSGALGCVLVNAQGQHPFPGRSALPSWAIGTWNYTASDISGNLTPTWLDSVFGGVDGFNTSTGGSPLPEGFAQDVRHHTRYLTTTVTASSAFNSGSGPTDHYSLAWSQTQDFDTGAVVAESITESWDDPISGYASYTKNFALNADGTYSGTPGPYTTQGGGVFDGFAVAVNAVASGGTGSGKLTTTVDSIDYTIAWTNGPGSNTAHYNITLSGSNTLENAFAAAENLRDNFNLANLATVYTWSNGTSGTLNWGAIGYAQYSYWAIGTAKAVLLTQGGGAGNSVSYDVNCGFTGNVLASKLRGRDDQSGHTSCLYAQQESNPSPSTIPPPGDNGVGAIYPDGVTNCTYVSAADILLSDFAFTYGTATLYLYGCIAVPGGTCC